MIWKAIDEGLEGLVLKDVDSVYEPGKRHWLKVDVVPLLLAYFFRINNCIYRFLTYARLKRTIWTMEKWLILQI